MPKRSSSLFLCWLILGSTLAAQRTAHLVQQEIRQAEMEVPKLAEVLQLTGGMSVADVGAGGGAMSMILARHLGESGRVYATDIRPEMLADIRELVARERLANVTVLEGAARGGHGVPATILIDEVCAEGLTVVRTISQWPPNDQRAPLFLTLFRKP